MSVNVYYRIIKIPELIQAKYSSVNDGKNAVYSYYEILFSHKKEQDSNIYNDMENLKNIMVSKKDKHKSLKTVWFYLYEALEKEKTQIRHW